MKLIYWCCVDEDGASSSYNIREATKKAALKERDSEGPEWAARYSEPFKVVVQYDSGLDLLKQCLGEGGIWEYPR